MNWKLRHHRRVDTRGQNPLTQDHVTVHRTDWLFISNWTHSRDDKAEIWTDEGAEKSSAPRKLTVPPKISALLRYRGRWSESDDYVRDGVWGDLRNESEASDGGSWGKLVVQKREKGGKKSMKRMEWGNILHRFSLNKKGERWRHFTCWRMKVFIVAKMRATLQKQHRDTTVTQPGARLGPLIVPHCKPSFLIYSLF